MRSASPCRGAFGVRSAQHQAGVGGGGVRQEAEVVRLGGGDAPALSITSTPGGREGAWERAFGRVRAVRQGCGRQAERGEQRGAQPGEGRFHRDRRGVPGRGAGADATLGGARPSCRGRGRRTHDPAGGDGAALSRTCSSVISSLWSDMIPLSPLLPHGHRLLYRAGEPLHPPSRQSSQFAGRESRCRGRRRRCRPARRRPGIRQRQGRSRAGVAELGRRRAPGGARRSRPGPRRRAQAGGTFAPVPRSDLTRGHPRPDAPGDGDTGRSRSGSRQGRRRR